MLKRGLPGVFAADYEVRGCNMGFILTSCFVIQLNSYAEKLL